MADGSWFVADPFGRYDASDPTRVPGAGWRLNGEFVPFHRLRRRYYEPALLAGIFDPEVPVRAVPPLAALTPPPVPEVTLLSSGAAQVVVEPRGGGVGTVRVRVNGREISRRASDGDGPFVVKLEGAPIVAGGRNVIDVVASNAEETIDSAVELGRPVAA
jgi:hypothetical protein